MDPIDIQGTDEIRDALLSIAQAINGFSCTYMFCHGPKDAVWVDHHNVLGIYIPENTKQGV